ncbi:MAG TPA: hypothetical protein V6C82_00910 [Chroococcales cyanobacterium]
MKGPSRKAVSAVSFLVFGMALLAGCSVLDVLPPNNKPVIPQKAGSLSVFIEGWSNFAAQATLADVERLVVSVEPQGSPILTKTLDRSQFSSSAVNFAPLNAGTATVSMAAFDAAAKSAAIQAGQNTQVNLVLQLGPTYVYVAPSPTASVTP